MDAWPALVAGVSAGLAVAVPLGAIAVLLVTTAVEVGRPQALAGAAGIATADLVFASAAAVGGTTIAGFLAPYLGIARIVAAALLLVVAAFLVRSALRTEQRSTRRAAPRGAYGRFLGLTLLNPSTIATFAAVIVALPAALVDTTSERFAFVFGAAAASLLWQALLATAGLAAQRLLGSAGRRVTRLVGAAVIAGLAIIALLS